MSRLASKFCRCVFNLKLFNTNMSGLTWPSLSEEMLSVDSIMFQIDMKVIVWCASHKPNMSVSTTKSFSILISKTITQ